MHPFAPDPQHSWTFPIMVAPYLLQMRTTTAHANVVPSTALQLVCRFGIQHTDITSYFIFYPSPTWRHTSVAASMASTSRPSPSLTCPLHTPHTPPTRRGELSGLQPYIPTDRLAPPGSPVVLAGVPVHEQGPLARCAPFMDTAARRVLPGHLLRRARVLSSLQVWDRRVTAVHVTPSVTGQQQHAIDAVQSRISSGKWLL